MQKELQYHDLSQDLEEYEVLDLAVQHQTTQRSTTIVRSRVQHQVHQYVSVGVTLVFIVSRILLTMPVPSSERSSQSSQASNDRTIPNSMLETWFRGSPVDDPYSPINQTYRHRVAEVAPANQRRMNSQRADSGSGDTLPGLTQSNTTVLDQSVATREGVRAVEQNMRQLESHQGELMPRYAKAEFLEGPSIFIFGCGFMCISSRWSCGSIIALCT